MKILGISCHYHDASAALVVDGRLIASAAEERFSRHKHDPTFPSEAARFCLRQGGLKGEDLDFVAFHEDPATKLSRTLSTSLFRFPFSLPTFLKTAREAMSTGLWIQRDLSRRLQVPAEKVICVPHHMSHAAHSFLTSPFSEAAVVTLDAVGEWTSSAIFRANRKDGNCAIEPVDVSPFPHSLGLVYSAFTSFLGFKVNDGECSTMALAGFGKPRFVEQVRQILRVREDGTHEVEDGWFDLASDGDVPVTKKFVSAFGKPRHFRDKYSFDSLEDIAPMVGDDEQRFADVACSIQQVLEEAVVAYARRARRLTGLPHVAYAGGVALNCVANGVLMRERAFDEVYIPPDPGDGGGAAGAALYLHSLKCAVPKASSDFHPYFGASIAAEELEGVIPHLSPEVWSRFSLLRPRPLKTGDLKSHRFPDESSMLQWTAERIHEGRIVGWCQGRFENGPRALGNRSILIRPGDCALARRLSERVKLRAAFRPYAASFTDAEALRSLESEDLLRMSTSRWMQASFKVKDEAKAALRAAMHVDGTTRPHCVSRSENPLYHDLLVEIGRRSGREAVLNTSLNEAGYPLAASATDALMIFSRTDLDILVLGNYALEKPWKS